LPLVIGREVRMTVDDLPFAVNAPVDVSDADDHVLLSALVDSYRPAFEADGIGQITA
jgi:hypothetical protein